MKGFIYSFVFLAALGLACALLECPPENGEDTVSVPNPANCTSFYICDAGQHVLTQCPGGLEFNAELGVCDWPENAKCVAETETEEDEVAPETDAEEDEAAPETDAEEDEAAPETDAEEDEAAPETDAEEDQTASEESGSEEDQDKK